MSEPWHMVTIRREELEKLRADKGELYQMLKAIVDTNRAGYAWMDMTKPQALLDRVVADHDELTLWTIEQLRAEVVQLRDEITRLNHVAIHKAYNDGVLYAANLCADKVNFYHPNGQALEAIMKEFDLYEP